MKAATYSIAIFLSLIAAVWLGTLWGLGWAFFLTLDILGFHNSYHANPAICIWYGLFVSQTRLLAWYRAFVKLKISRLDAEKKKVQSG